MELNFNKVKKHYLNITLIDGRVVMVGTPTKSLLDKIVVMDSKLKIDNDEENATSKEQIDELYNICAEIMSSNKTATKITGKELGEMFDVEDLLLFFNTYMTFLDSVAKLKN